MGTESGTSGDLADVDTAVDDAPATTANARGSARSCGRDWAGIGLTTIAGCRAAVASLSGMAREPFTIHTEAGKGFRLHSISIASRLSCLQALERNNRSSVSTQPCTETCP